MTIPMTPEYRAQIAEMLARPYPQAMATQASASAVLAAARALLDELVQCETRLAETSADGAQWQARAETAERELAEVREQLAGERQRVADDIEAWAEGIGWYEDGGVWVDAIDVARTGRRHAAEQQPEDGAAAKFAADMDRLRKTDPSGAQWVEHILTERAEQTEGGHRG